MKSRTENAKLNIIYGYIAQMGILVLSFAGRKIFLNYLSVDYLGIHGLFSNILTILSLAEMGLDSAVAFSLYRPVAEENYPMIASMLDYFKKIYWVISSVIFAVGVLLIPFFESIIDSDLSDAELVSYYLLFLINTAVSYLGAHNLALLAAYQEHRIKKIESLFLNLVLQILHIIVLALFRNYYIYLCVNVLGTISEWRILQALVKRRHPESYYKSGCVDFEKSVIFERIRSTFVYKLGSVAVNNSTNIVITYVLGLAMVGLYSNYITVVAAVQMIISTISMPLISGLGNMCITESKEKKQSMFQMLVWIYSMLSFIGFAGFSLLFQELITYWIGAQYLLERWAVFAIAITFLMSTMENPIIIYREANGLFSEVKYLILGMAGLNILAAVVLGSIWGLFGVLIANPISRFLTLFWYEPRILYKKIFGITVTGYWKLLLRCLLLGVLGTYLSAFLVTYIPDVLWLLPVKALLVCAVIGGSYLLLDYRSKECETVLQYISHVLKK